MLKASLLRFHRWIALGFALPLFGIIVTGLVLSVEPAVNHYGARHESVPLATVEAALARYDPQGRARALTVRAAERRIALGGVRQNPLVVDLATGEETQVGPLSAVFGWSRRTHERLMLEGSWLVTASTVAMLAVIALGVGMGWPRFRNNLAGWHKGVAWTLLPLVVLSPVTGLLLAYRVTFAPASVAEAPAVQLPLVEAIRRVASERDLASVIWIRPQGGRMVARLDDAGELRTYAVNRDGLVAQPRSWPRLIHEGTFSAVWGSLMNLITSIALLLLLGTGTVIWLRRRLRRRSRHAIAA